jgi:hypothetical protein
MFESQVSSLVLFLHTKFEIRQKQIGGYVALLIDIPSLDQLRSLFAEFIVSVNVPVYRRPRKVVEILRHGTRPVARCSVWSEVSGIYDE